MVGAGLRLALKRRAPSKRCRPERSPALFSDDATSSVILRPALLPPAGRGISPAAGWRARDRERDLLFVERYVLRIINLRALQPIRIINVNRLPLRIKIQRRFARFAMPVAGIFDPAKRQMRFRTNRRRVHINNPGLQIALRAER